MAVIGIVNDLKCPVTCPRGGGCGAHVRLEDHVLFGEAFVACGFTPVAGDGLIKDAVGQVEILLPCKFGGGYRLATGNAGQIRDDAFHFVQPFALKVSGGSFGQCFFPIGHQALSFLKNAVIRAATFSRSSAVFSLACAALICGSGTKPLPRWVSSPSIKS